jgi:hypothetical protein
MRTIQQKGKSNQLKETPKTATPNQADFENFQEEASILQFHRLVGNQAVQRLLQTNPEAGDGHPPATPGRILFEFMRGNLRAPANTVIQAKLDVSQPGDPYEQEADQVAESVMRIPEQQVLPSAHPGTAPADNSDVQRQCSSCVEEGDQLQRQAIPVLEEPEEKELPAPVEEEISPTEETANTEPILANLELNDDPVIVHFARSVEGMGKERSGSLPSPGEDGSLEPEDTMMEEGVGTLLQASAGQPLDSSVRRFLEPRFGVDFSQVRVHTGTEAAASAKTLEAQAYTVGRNIVFGVGRYQPATVMGKRLLAHELTHVVQQSRIGGSLPRQEMIPGFYTKHQARVVQTLTQPLVQCDKIEHRQLAWDDFQGKAPASSKFGASTASGFHSPDLKSVIPKELEAEDTGEECVVAKSKKGDIMGTTFRVTTNLDSEKIVVLPYMWQEKSWRMAWTTDENARKKKCMKEAVAPAKKFFKNELKRIDKEVKKQEKACKKAFKEGSDWFEVAVGDQVTRVNSVEECAEAMESIRQGMEAELSYDFTMAGVTATCTSQDEIEGAFLDSCVNDVLEAASGKLLEHEQGHFDITNWSSAQAQDALRVLVDGFDQEFNVCAKGETEKQQKAGKAKVVSKAKKALAKQLTQLNKEFAKGKKDLSTVQKQYDSETQHGVEEAIQAQWQEQLVEGLP